jgi:hypothetical protein
VPPPENALARPAEGLAGASPTVQPPRLLKARLEGGVWNHYFFSNLSTRLALPWTRVFLALGFSPRTVSLLSFGLAWVGALLIAFGGGLFWPAFGGVLFIVSLLWDHSDGQVARATRTGTLQGGLLDTILDRWIEMLWIAGLAVGMALSPGRALLVSEPWVFPLLGAWAVHAQLYVRWSNIQRDLYLLQKELKAARREQAGDTITIDARPITDRTPDLSRTFLPFAFNRDTTFWMLLAVTLTPWWDLGLAAFAALHTVLGLRQNSKTFRELRKADTRAVRALLDPDYHK